MRRASDGMPNQRRAQERDRSKRTSGKHFFEGATVTRVQLCACGFPWLTLRMERGALFQTAIQLLIYSDAELQKAESSAGPREPDSSAKKHPIFRQHFFISLCDTCVDILQIPSTPLFFLTNQDLEVSKITAELDLAQAEAKRARAAEEANELTLTVILARNKELEEAREAAERRCQEQARRFEGDVAEVGK